jgi:glycosyltransferase involved in cell wall biosynthesis
MTLVSRLVFFLEKKTSKSSNRILTNDVSIVIPVRDNQRGINNYLESFFNSHQPFEFPKEIIVIDNNSNPPIKIPDQFLKHEIVRLCKCQTPGPGAARNYGAKHSKGEWLLFNDSDCLATDTLLKGYVNNNNGSLAYAGNIQSYGHGILSKYYESQEILLPMKAKDENGEFRPQYLITANALVWKPAFMEIGGFNEAISIAGGEDVDLGLRLSQIGRLSYAFESIALHDFDDGLIGFYKRFKRYGQGNRIIQEMYNTDMKPLLFRPNVRTPFNEVVAKLQFLFLSIGFRRQTQLFKAQLLKGTTRKR